MSEPLLDLFLPPGSRLLGEAILAWAVSLPSAWAASEASLPPCPLDMAFVGDVCVDLLPYPNNPDEEPLLGVSAVVEEYLPDEEAWDCETLCGWQAKRLCTWDEWQRACEGTPADACGPVQRYRDPKWPAVMRRSARELARLDQHARASQYPGCVSATGVRMMGTLEEWVALPRGGYAFSRGFWSREGTCHTLNTAHAANWHGYSNACRCCRDAP